MVVEIKKQSKKKADRDRERTLTLLHRSPADFLAKAPFHVPPEFRPEILDLLSNWIDELVSIWEREFPNYRVKESTVSLLPPEHDWLASIDPHSDLIYKQATHIGEELFAQYVQQYRRKTRGL